jgi:putative ABC transport system permease protein
MPIDRMWGAVRSAVRAAAARPGFSLIVVLTLALGFGAGSAVFAIADAVLLRPLPYHDPGRLVFVWQTLRQQNVFELEATPAGFVTWKNRLKSMSDLAMIAADSVTLTGGDNAERVGAARVTASTFPLLGIAPREGRAFTPAEDDAAAAPVAIVSDGLWRRRFGADPRIVGTIVRVNGTPHTVVGIMPVGARLPGPRASSSDLWLPARLAPAEWANEISHNYTVLGRLADGVTLDAAAREVDALASALTAEEPKTHTGLGARVVSIAEDTVKEIRPTLLVLAGGVVLLILITCANASTLFLVHASSRRQETAVRTALGASRGRLVEQATVHALVLTMAGSAAGLMLGRAILAYVLPTIGDSLPPSAIAQIDGRTTAITVGLALAIGAVLGGLGGLAIPADRLADSLRSGARTSAAPHVARARSALVVVQVAFAVMLLGSAGLMIRSIARLARVTPGFSAERVLTFRLALEGTAYASEPQRAAFVTLLAERLSAASGVERVGITSHLPLAGSRGANGFEIDGRPPTRGEVRIADQRHVTPGYFQAMGIRVLRGRAFTAVDAAATEPVVMINRTMAARFWPADDPLNQRIRVGAGFDSGRWFRIVGIVDDVHHVSMSRPPVTEMYRPYAQAAVPNLTIVLKTRGAPAVAAPIARAVVQSIDRDLPLYDVRTMEERIARSFAQLRAAMLLLAITAALAAMLAGVAIYGSIWYSVSQRIPEIGLRFALGASPTGECARIVGRAFRLSAIGAAAGVGGAVASASLLRALLFETPATDPGTYTLVVALVVGLTALASFIPARRAMRIDPLVALRSE